jgi:hypothetical protein
MGNTCVKRWDFCIVELFFCNLLFAGLKSDDIDCSKFALIAINAISNRETRPEEFLEMLDTECGLMAALVDVRSLFVGVSLFLCLCSDVWETLIFRRLSSRSSVRVCLMSKTIASHSNKNKHSIERFF